MTEIRMTGICKSFSDTQVLKSVNFYAESGQFVTILGPSGCGKSTLMRVLSGLEKHDAGEIYIGDKEVSKADPAKRGVGMVFQNYALFPNLNVHDNLAFGLALQKLPKKEIEARIEEILQTVQLSDKVKSYPHQLSGGQCQRVALARCLVTKPKVLLLDEPLSALDAKIRKELRKDLKRLQRELGITTIMVTHDQEEAMSLSDAIYLMNGGNIVQSGTPDEIYRRPKNCFVASFIGHYNILSPQSVSNLFPNLGPVEDCHYGIRPEAFHDQYVDGALKVTAKLCDVSLMGNILQYTLNVSNETICAERLNQGCGLSRPIGSSMDLYIAPEEIMTLA